MECKQLNPNLVSGKTSFVVLLNLLWRHIFGTFITEDQKFMVMIREWNSVGNGGFACDVLGSSCDRRAMGTNPAIQQHLTGHGCRLVLLPGAVCAVCKLCTKWCPDPFLLLEGKVGNSDFVWCFWVGLCVLFHHSNYFQPLLDLKTAVEIPAFRNVKVHCICWCPFV